MNEINRNKQQIVNENEPNIMGVPLSFIEEHKNEPKSMFVTWKEWEQKVKEKARNKPPEISGSVGSI